MSKGDGLKIGIKFTEDLVGDVSGNESAFAITGQEYEYVNGVLVDREYQVEKVERYGVPALWSIAQENPTLTDVIKDNGYYLDSIAVGDGGYSENLAPNKTYFAKGTLSGNPMNNAFDGSLNTFWRDSGGVPSWLGVDFGEEIIITKINMAGISTRIKDFTLQGSNNFSTWDNIYSGQQTNDNVLRTHEFENHNSYRYYRVYILSVWSSGYGAGLSELEMYSASEPVLEYLENGSILAELEITGQYRVRWSEDKPTNTDIIIEYTTGETQGQWQEVSNGEVISVNTNLWLRATLSTEDTAVTPILEDIWLEDTDAPQDKILITMDWWGRFNNVEDKIKVLYDASKGSLSGAGGAVESFEIEFTPEDLIQTPNPNAEELIKAYPYEVVLDLNELDFEKSYANEYLKAYPYSIVLTLTDIGEINP